MSWVQLQMRLFQDKGRHEAPGPAAELQRQQLGGGEEQIATQEASGKAFLNPSNTSPLVATSQKGLEAPHGAEPALSASVAVKQDAGAGGSEIDGIRADGRANGARQVEEIVPARGVQALVERAMVSSDSEDD